MSENMWLFVVLCAYLLGSIPFGLLWANMAGIKDVRKRGSGNIGATNIARTGGKWLGLLTLVSDAAKGSVAVLLSKYLLPSDLSAILAAGTVVLGHMFPIWLKGRGGKGVATAFGSMLIVSPIVSAIALVVWISVFAWWRISSLATLLTLVASIIAAYFVATAHVVTLLLFLAAFIVAKHMENIKRLIDGKELRF